jgi:hypothetical protein
MSFPLEAAVARAGFALGPNVTQFLERIHARPAYRRALAAGGEFRLAYWFDWPRSQEAISADITPSPAGKKRGFCRLCLTLWHASSGSATLSHPAAPKAVPCTARSPKGKP